GALQPGSTARSISAGDPTSCPEHDAFAAPVCRSLARATSRAPSLDAVSKRLQQRCKSRIAVPLRHLGKSESLQCVLSPEITHRYQQLQIGANDIGKYGCSDESLQLIELKFSHVHRTPPAL